MKHCNTVYTMKLSIDNGCRVIRWR